MKLKKFDFVKLDFSVKDADGNIVDTTYQEEAEKLGYDTEKGKALGPKIICVGEKHIFEKIEEEILKRGVGEYAISILSVDAFGLKDPKLLQLVPIRVFRKEKIVPYAGLIINLDDRYGKITAVSGGRVVVDFNHPLAGADLVYDIKVHEKIEDISTKVSTIIENSFMQFPYQPEFVIKDNELEFDMPEGSGLFKLYKKKILDVIPQIKMNLIKRIKMIRRMMKCQEKKN